MWDEEKRMRTLLLYEAEETPASAPTVLFSSIDDRSILSPSNGHRAGVGFIAVEI